MNGIPPELHVSMFGEIGRNEAKIVHVFGTRENGWQSTTAFGDACQYLDTSQSAINTPLPAQPLYLVSTSTLDAANGTGIREVVINYLDADGVDRFMNVSTNGTTPVALGSGFSAIQFMESSAVGSLGVAAGNLAITSINGAATVATTFEYIKAGSGRSLSARYVVPKDMVAFLVAISGASVGATMDIRIRADCFSGDRSLSPNCMHFQERVFIAANIVFDSHMAYLRFPAGATIKVSATPGAAQAGNKLDASLQFIVVKMPS